MISRAERQPPSGDIDGKSVEPFAAIGAAFPATFEPQGDVYGADQPQRERDLDPARAVDFGAAIQVWPNAGLGYYRSLWLARDFNYDRPEWGFDAVRRHGQHPLSAGGYLFHGAAAATTDCLRP
jgi:hypothetical protein